MDVKKTERAKISPKLESPEKSSLATTKLGEKKEANLLREEEVGDVSMDTWACVRENKPPQQLKILPGMGSVREILEGAKAAAQKLKNGQIERRPPPSDEEIAAFWRGSTRG